jgi:hypothetical protein
VTCDVSSFTYELTIFNLSGRATSVLVSPFKADDPTVDVRVWLELPDELRFTHPDAEPMRAELDPYDGAATFLFAVSAVDTPDGQRPVVARVLFANQVRRLRDVQGDLWEPTVIMPCEPSG